MRHFECLELEEALAYAAAGGQALHTHRIIVDERKAPQCFVRALRRGEDIAHLFDQDSFRLRKTVKKLGVNIIFIERPGQPGQHVDLCGKPLQRALALCETETIPPT